MIKYHFFGKECAIDKTSIDYSLLKNCLISQNFNTKFPIVLVNQIHGNNVLLIDDETKITEAEKFIDADAIVTNLKNLNIAVLTADCVPILLFDEQNQIIAAVHAGWQGAFKNVLNNAIDEMIKIGAKIENIKAAIGPCIRQNSYEIDQNFYDRFLKENSANQKFFIKSAKQNHYLFDLVGYVKEKLILKGIAEIFDAQIDTYQDEEKFFSYRRNTHQNIIDELRNISVIQIAKI